MAISVYLSCLSYEFYPTEPSLMPSRTTIYNIIAQRVSQR